MSNMTLDFTAIIEELISSSDSIAPSMSRYDIDKNYGKVTDEELKMEEFTSWCIQVRVLFKKLSDTKISEFRELDREYRKLVEQSKSFHSKSIFVHQIKTLLLTAKQFANMGTISKEKGYIIETPLTKKEEYLLDIFISHSNKDKDIAEKLVDILRTSLNMAANQLRCTSVDGYKLRGGVNTKDQLRLEILSSKILIGIITEQSLSSAFVLFELGARWGSEKQMIPVLAKGTKPTSLKGPLESINCLSCDSSAEVHQLIEQIADELKITKQNTASYHSKIESLVNYSSSYQNDCK